MFYTLYYDNYQDNLDDLYKKMITGEPIDLTLLNIIEGLISGRLDNCEFDKLAILKSILINNYPDKSLIDRKTKNNVEYYIARYVGAFYIENLMYMRGTLTNFGNYDKETLDILVPNVNEFLEELGIETDTKKDKKITKNK